MIKICDRTADTRNIKVVTVDDAIRHTMNTVNPLLV